MSRGSSRWHGYTRTGGSKRVKNLLMLLKSSVQEVHLTVRTNGVECQTGESKQRKTQIHSDSLATNLKRKPVPRGSVACKHPFQRLLFASIHAQDPQQGNGWWIHGICAEQVNSSAKSWGGVAHSSVIPSGLTSSTRDWANAAQTQKDHGGCGREGRGLNAPQLVLVKVSKVSVVGHGFVVHWEIELLAESICKGGFARANHS